MIGHVYSGSRWGRRWRHGMLCMDVMRVRMRMRMWMRGGLRVCVWMMVVHPPSSRDGERARRHAAQRRCPRRWVRRRLGEDDLGGERRHLCPQACLACVPGVQPTTNLAQIGDDAHRSRESTAVISPADSSRENGLHLDDLRAASSTTEAREIGRNKVTRRRSRLEIVGCSTRKTRRGEGGRCKLRRAINELANPSHLMPIQTPPNAVVFSSSSTFKWPQSTPIIT